MKDAAVILWRLSDTPPSANLLQDDEEENRESWTAFKVLRFVLMKCQLVSEIDSRSQTETFLIYYWFFTSFRSKKVLPEPHRPMMCCFFNSQTDSSLCLKIQILG